MKKIKIFRKIGPSNMIRCFYIVIFVLLIIVSIFLYYFLQKNVYKSIYSNNIHDVVNANKEVSGVDIIGLNKLEADIDTIENNFEKKKAKKGIENFRDIFK